MNDKEKIFIIYRNKKIALEGKTIKVKDVLKMLNLSSEYAFAVKDGRILDENENIKEGEIVKIISAISGG